MTNYQEFLARKRRLAPESGIQPGDLSGQLFDWQRAIVRWALKKGRAAIFADCGLGKTAMQVTWADALPGRALILAPLCVAEQTVEEAVKFGVSVRYAKTMAEADSRIVITNYERLEKFDLRTFDAVVLDESSILKAFDGKTRTRLIEACKGVKYRLCCTATPSPNDIAELANHAEFLGLMTRAEFLATWFVHDDQGWRMKRHAVQPFYRWMASWAIAMRKPSDLGYADDGFALPALSIRDHVIEVSGPTGDTLFPELSTKGLKGRLTVRRGSLDDRVAAAASLIANAPKGHRSCQWLVWCGLNEEAEALSAAIPNAVNVQGSDDYDAKVDAARGFAHGLVKVIVSKARIFGYGMNFQNCHHMAFVGMSDSYEQYYQCVRRSWRFGQMKPVEAHVIVSEAEQVIVENVRRKEAAAASLAEGLIAHMREFEREELAS